jgi:NADH-quinone oxidoreductase subunit A
MNAYFCILVFIAVGVIIAVVPIIAGHLIGKKKPNFKKNAAYECGIPASQDARLPFDVRYYLVAILFILFDLETAFLFPWAITLRKIGLPGFYAMAVFIGVLVLGFIYEWRKGALEWE